MGIFDLFKGPERRDARAHAKRRGSAHADIVDCAADGGDVPRRDRARLEGARSGTLPWIATLTPAELLIARSHGLRPIAAVSATCWLHYGWSWTEGHAQGWDTALRGCSEEARPPAPTRCST